MGWLPKCREGKEDCFAADNDGLRDTYCRVLVNTEFHDKKGNKRDCPFYKPRNNKNEEKYDK